VTAEDNQKGRLNQEELQKEVVKITEAWKKMYFDTEDALAKSVEKYVSSDSFTEFLEQLGKQYLTVYKASSQNVDRFFDNHPLPTKKDIARVCGLVVDVEEKVDQLENDINGNMAGLASSLIRLVDFQVILRDEMTSLRKDMHALQGQLQQIQVNVAALSKGSGTKTTADPQTQDRPGSAPAEPIRGKTVAAPRPRSRSTKPQDLK
jgi:polyhydroxyalkanoic acid synthase PhaR subunit